MSRTWPVGAKKIAIGAIQREFTCPFCGTKLKSNLRPVLLVVFLISSVPALAFLDNAVSFLAVTVAVTLLCAFIGLYFISLETA